MNAPLTTVDVDSLITGLIDAIRVEVEVYRRFEGVAADDGACDAATTAAWAAGQRLCDLPVELTDCVPDYPLALALYHRRWLVMEGSYSDIDDRAECRMVDAVLAGSRFDNVPMLWHIDGRYHQNRPTDAVLRTGWEALS